MRFGKKLLIIAALLGAAACEFRTVSENDDDTQANQAATPQSSPQEQARQAQLAQMRTPARQEMRDVRFVVDVSERELQILRGEQVIGTHPVAVGTEEWPTPTGEWQIHRVDINPEWIPPKEEEWAKDEETKAPGDPENPMGKARLVYRMPNTIHGTDDLASLGKASSHGSIRVANEVVVQLAEMLLKSGGSWDGPQWFQQMLQNETEEYQVKLQDPVAITVQD
jgi:lipoprotein-anchoring transpeptidase ErfK/SrfK